MPRAKERPTLLVFTRGAERETRRRRLLPPRLASLELALHHRCLEATLTAGRTAGCALAMSSPCRSTHEDVIRLPQRHGTFGDRLRAAMRQAHALGTGPVLVVGTDTPRLEARHLRTAIDRLEAEPDSVVVGPAPDGGIYLLASHRPLDGILAGVPWRRRDTIDSLLAALAAAGLRVCLLEPLADLDRPQDLARWASGRAVGIAGIDSITGFAREWLPIVELVRRALLALRRLAVPAVIGRTQGCVVALPTGRAPPRFL